MGNSAQCCIFNLKKKSPKLHAENWEISTTLKIMKSQDCPEYALWDTGPVKTCLHCCAPQVQADSSRGCLLLSAAPSTGHDPSGVAYQIFTLQCITVAKLHTVVEQHNNFMAGVSTAWGTGVKRHRVRGLSTSHTLEEKFQQGKRTPNTMQGKQQQQKPRTPDNLSILSVTKE